MTTEPVAEPATETPVETSTEGQTEPFDLCGALPIGTTVLEASAGTGKTFAIAALAARYVAEGVPLERMLLVTFTRMATGELRERVRERLLSVLRGLDLHLAGRPVDPTDTVLNLLATGPPAAVAVRRARLATAVAGFDAATITTTHGFCQQMLASLGLAGNAESDLTIVEDIEDLLAETVDDLVLARVRRGQAYQLRRRQALATARAALEQPGTPLADVPAEPGSAERQRYNLARTVRTRMEERKRRARVITYDDLLTRLAAAIAHPDGGPSAVRRLRRRFDVVLVDEFQDTDRLQWLILARAFEPEVSPLPQATEEPEPGPGATPRALVLIGDPKQAIYAFRGADVHAYLDATRNAVVRTLDVNWRTDQALVDAANALFDPSRLGHPDIVYRPVRAAPGHQEPGLVGAPVTAALRFRVLHREDGLVRRTNTGWAQVAPSRAVVAKDLAADVVRLLSSEAETLERDEAGAVVARRRIRPGDIAVLTARNRDSVTVRDALAAVGVPAVVNGAGSVFATPSATDWLRLLEAIERPSSSTRIRTLALTPWIGWSAAAVDAAGDEAWEELHALCHRLGGVLARSGVAALAEVVTRVNDLPRRLLAETDGERRLTDLRHLGQLLHAEAAGQSLGVTALAGWLRRHIADTGSDTGAEEQTRRLESDADAVQVLTVHRSKGLEFPVVYAPYLWDPTWIPSGQPVVYHDREEPGEPRKLDVSVAPAGAGQAHVAFVKHANWSREEQRGEDLRLAYVALTRAKHQAVLWWVGSQSSTESSIGRLLFGRQPDGTVATTGRRDVRDDDAVAALQRLADRAPGRISVERVALPEGDVHLSAEGGRRPALETAAWSRRIDRRWQRTSYTGLTSAAHDGQVGSEPEQAGSTDEALLPPADGEVAFAGGGAFTAGVAGVAGVAGGGAGVAGDEALRGFDLPLAPMPAGAAVGTIVHSLLETLDFSAPDLAGAVADAIGACPAPTRVQLGAPDVVTEGLVAALLTPLGALVEDRPLAGIRPADRLDELAFEVPVAGGDRPTGDVSVADIADLLAAWVPATDPLAGYPALLRGLADGDRWRGYLTGSLDLVVRLPAAIPAPGEGSRFVVMDYKTNLLGHGDAVTAWDYRPAALDEAMRRAHYPLQAMLYLVALHRYLRWRLPGYDPARHLGGVLYLFLRGMAGPDVPRVGGQPCGVWSWLPPAGFVPALSDLLDGGELRAPGEAGS